MPVLELVAEPALEVVLGLVLKLPEDPDERAGAELAGFGAAGLGAAGFGAAGFGALPELLMAIHQTYQGSFKFSLKRTELYYKSVKVSPWKTIEHKTSCFHAQ